MNTRWLYYQVHGVMPPRQSPRRPRRGPARSRQYRAWVRSLPCAVCGSPEAEAAHAGDDGGMSMKASDYSCIPLCTDDHTLGAASYHRLGRDEFERRHELDLAELVRRLNHDWFAYGGLVK